MPFSRIAKETWLEMTNCAGGRCSLPGDAANNTTPLSGSRKMPLTVADNAAQTA